LYIVTIATRDAIIGEKWLKCEKEPANESENKSDRYMVAVRRME